MLLGAARFGCGEALIAELSESQPEMLTRFRHGIPRMYDKAYRWVDEMQEISDFLEQNPPSRDIYAAIARLYDDLASAYAEGARRRQRDQDPRPCVRSRQGLITAAVPSLALPADGSRSLLVLRHLMMSEVLQHLHQTGMVPALAAERARR